MDETQRQFLFDLLDAHGPAGDERAVQRVFVEYVEGFADEVTVDAYGNVVATVRGPESAPTVAFAGHADEVGFVVTKVDDRGFLRVETIGSPSPEVSQGRHVVVHTDDGPLPGVIGAKPAHLREEGETVEGVSALHVDVGVRDRESTVALVSVGDPVTVARQRSELRDGRLAAPAMDDRTGVWTAAEGLRRAVEAGADATVHAVSTIQEEVGKGGARMVGDSLQPDVAVAVDVTFAADSPDVPGDFHSGVVLGGGPAIARGGPNHPAVVEALRSAAADEDLSVQFEGLGGKTSTDADAIFEQAGGVPTALVSVPSRYMHSPAEVVDFADLEAVADLLGAFAVRATETAPFGVDL